MNLRHYLTAINALAIILFIGLFIFGNLALFNIAYVAVFFFAALRTLTTKANKRSKLILVIAYTIVLAMQLTFCTQVVFAENAPFFEQTFRRLFGVLMLLLPLVVSRYISVGKYSHFYLPSIQEIATVSFAQLHSNSDLIISAIDGFDKVGKSLSADNLKTIIEDLPRHDSFRYINNGSLTPEYFEEAMKSFNDPYIYIVISSTGSAASEIISVFTQKQYNHASLAFDRGLKTIISYNGGERVYPPGLNHEMLEFFNKKPDASIIVYKLSCTYEQKQAILNKVEEINRNGSAYNMIGLVFKYSHKPNIMFCSQFVYKMLQIAELAYFNKKGDHVTPTDLIEQDYYRKLQFDYEIHLNHGTKTGL